MWSQMYSNVLFYKKVCQKEVVFCYKESGVPESNIVGAIETSVNEREEPAQGWRGAYIGNRV